MTKVTYIGGDDDGNAGTVSIGPLTFALNKPVEVSDERLLGKLKANRFFEVEGAPKADNPAPDEADDGDDAEEDSDNADPVAPRPRGRPPLRSGR